MGRSFKAIVFLVIAAYIGYVLNFVCVGGNTNKEIHLRAYLEHATNAYVRPYFSEVYDLIDKDKKYTGSVVGSGKQIWSMLDKSFEVEAKTLNLHTSVSSQICLVKYHALSLIDRIWVKVINLWLEKRYLLIPITWQTKAKQVFGGLYESSSGLVNRASEEIQPMYNIKNMSVDMLSKAWAFIVLKTETVVSFLVDRVYFNVNRFIHFSQNHILQFRDKGSSKDRVIDYGPASNEYLNHVSEAIPSGEAELQKDEEPSTMLITSTVLLTQDEPRTEVHLTIESIPTTAVGNLEKEVKYWETRVNHTLTAAERSLEKEFTTKLTHRIPYLQKELSKKLEDVQNKNYDLYRKMNAMIKEIEKDASQMLELGKKVDSEAVSGRPFYTRQGMREGIKNSSTMTDDSIEVVKNLLDKNHNLMVKDYFSDLQGTIDVLESFADLTMQEFTRRLHLLISHFEGQLSVDKDMQWTAWKEVHRTKESIFDFRDRLVNEAHAYQKDASSKAPLALRNWDSLLKSIHNDVNMLLQDNAEYLYLLRARANIAFQSRENENWKLQSKAKEGQEEKGYKGEEEVCPGEEARPKEEAHPGEQPQPGKEAQPVEEATPGQEPNPREEVQPGQ